MERAKTVWAINIPLICRGRRGQCPWSKLFHVEQFYSTWQIKIAPHDKQFCTTWQLLVMKHFYHVAQQQIYQYLQCGTICHDSTWKFLLQWRNCSALLWFSLFGCKIHYRFMIYALLCGAKIRPNILSVEQQWKISHMAINPSFLHFPISYIYMNGAWI